MRLRLTSSKRSYRINDHKGSTLWLGYVFIFALLLLRAAQGVGQYWDWSFPYFRDQIGNIFSRASLSWTPNQSGSPLGYSSDYFARFFLSLFRFLQPEWLLYFLLVSLFASGAYGVYLIMRQHTRKEVALLLGLVAWINPAIFYKYTAGHLDYLISLVLFIYLVYYLFYVFEKNLRSAVLVGIILGFIGTQIQFLVITPIFLTLFFLWNRHVWSWRYMLIICAIPLCMDLVWLSNFLQGAASVAGTGASKKGFTGLSSTSYLNIFSFTFSKATLLGYFYNSVQSFIYLLLFVVTTGLLVITKRKRSNDMVLLIFLLIMIFLCTGAFQNFNAGPITTLYPMFREVGHFAPLIVLATVLLLGRLLRRNALGWVALGVLVLTIGITWSQFAQHPQAVNYPAVRNKLAEFETFSNTHHGDYRSLTYPFFDEYDITSLGSNSPNGGLPLQNTGHDSFSAYAAGEFIYNAITPDQFKTSLQYKLLQTHDISILQPYNIRYIYDLSGIYESNYDSYVPTNTYDNNLSLIKNDPHFLDELIANNPGRVHRVSEHIVELTPYNPRVATNNTLFGVDSLATADEATNLFVTHTLGSPFNYAITNQITPYETQLTRLFNAIGTTSSISISKKAITQTTTIPTPQKTTLYTNPNQFDAFYQLVGNALTVYTRSSGTLYMNGQPLESADPAAHVLLQTTLTRGRQYYIAINKKVTLLQRGLNVSLGSVSSNDAVQLLTGNGVNLIVNPSFEQGVWQKSVADCANYDNNPQIGMSLDTQDKTDGSQSLQLTATRHNACTYSDFSLHGNTSYVLSYDYQSPNATLASYYLAFNNSDASPAHGFDAVSDQSWHHANELITAPAGTVTGRLYVYALENDQQQKIINRYDNFNLISMQTIRTVTVPGDSSQYVTQTLPSGTATFSFVDANYSYENLLRNGSFEQGLWRKDVADCANYDNNPQIGMSLDTQDKTDGSQSLQLTATRHNACTYASVNATSGANYLLSFSYHGNTAKQYGYNVSFNDPKASTHSEQLPIIDSGWHTFTTEVQAPQDASTLTLYLYAFESDGSTQNTVRYDNVKLIKLPDLASRYYVVTGPIATLQTPQQTGFTTVNATKRIAQITNARSPFLLNLSETYNSKWRLELNTAAVQGLHSWLPNARPIAIANQDHLTTDNYMNSWYVDPAVLCSNQASGCVHNADGSYSFELVAEFVPQRWFMVCLLIGSVTIIGSVTYLWYDWRRNATSKKGVWRWHS